MKVKFNNNVKNDKIDNKKIFEISKGKSYKNNILKVKYLNENNKKIK